ncbi:hypothetical protein C1I64_07445 [Rathayibacter festucae DSM 15932]|uniref:Uncharacterized protein n=1 Tax=Rathayibacter festucae DSM 15932 TaxID=1328866 RepID=A0A3T0SZU4_9MICO|nr:hypothetical protein C1I64_07445 [Rathayibacter festucae DSM 15932]
MKAFSVSEQSGSDRFAVQHREHFRGAELDAASVDIGAPRRCPAAGVGMALRRAARSVHQGTGAPVERERSGSICRGSRRRDLRPCALSHRFWYLSEELGRASRPKNQFVDEVVERAEKDGQRVFVLRVEDEDRRCIRLTVHMETLVPGVP